jgi:septal ring factor EnvC (AmiA/AmiB activator)
MTRYNKAFGVLFVTMFGLWGCARGPATSASSASASNHNDKIRALESKTAKLEDDVKNAAAVKEQLRRQLAESDEAQATLRQEIDRLQLVAKERDTLKDDLRARTADRDQLQTQYEGFRRNLKDLLGQAELSSKNTKPASNLTSAQPTETALPGGGN